MKKYTHENIKDLLVLKLKSDKSDRRIAIGDYSDKISIACQFESKMLIIYILKISFKVEDVKLKIKNIFDSIIEIEKNKQNFDKNFIELNVTGDNLAAFTILK